jgi:hypothetical protein
VRYRCVPGSCQVDFFFIEDRVTENIGEHFERQVGILGENVDVGAAASFVDIGFDCAADAFQQFIEFVACPLAAAAGAHDFTGETGQADFVAGLKIGAAGDADADIENGQSTIFHDVQSDAVIERDLFDRRDLYFIQFRKLDSLEIDLVAFGEQSG